MQILLIDHVYEQADRFARERQDGVASARDADDSRQSDEICSQFRRSDRKQGSASQQADQRSSSRN